MIIGRFLQSIRYSYITSVVLAAAVGLAGCSTDADSVQTLRGDAPDAPTPTVKVATQIGEQEVQILRRFARQIPDLSLNADEVRALIGQSVEAIEQSSPLWPVRVFVQAEWLRQSGDFAAARPLYRELAQWGGDMPYGDEWGGSSLSIFGLWRWVQALDADATVDADELQAALKLDRVLRNDARLATGIFTFSFLDSLPQIEEDLVRRLALLANENGLETKAQSLFLDYLRVATTDLGPQESALLDKIIEANWASRDRLTMLSAERLEELRRFDAAAQIWRGLLEAKDAYDRANAGLHLARYEARRFDAPRSEISARLDTVLLDAKEPRMIQEALYERARLWERGGGDQDLARFCADMTELLERYPNGVMADDARYRIARHAEHQHAAGGGPACFEGKTALEIAVEQYKQLRDFPGDNNWIESSYFRPAMMLYGVGGNNNLATAASLLQELLALKPDGALSRHAGFWRARILEDMGDVAAARAAFEAVVARHAFDYHGLRARMHLASGPDAASQLWPLPGLRAEIATQYRDNPPAESFNVNSPYHLRLAAVINSGLYAQVVNARRELKTRLPSQRLQTLSLADIDAVPGAITTLGLFLSFRQDATAAADHDTQAASHLMVQSVVGKGSKDWPLIMAFATGEVHRHSGSTEIGALPTYLHAAYPPAFRDLYLTVSEAHNVPPEVLYALSRRESLFDPSAISVADALGLFQFIPNTFRSLDENWKLLETSGAESRQAYLLDPRLNADLGGRWLREELLRRQNCVLLKELGKECNAANRSDDQLVLVPSPKWFPDGLSPRQQRVLMLSLMEHSKGYTNASSWLDRWRKEGRAEDFEYMLATADSAEARILVRNVLTDAAIAASIGLFATDTR